MNILTAFLRAWVGEDEYREARYAQSRTRSLSFRIWGRLSLAAAGLCFFLWQQVAEPSSWWGSNSFGILVLVLTLSQAAGPLIFVLIQVTERLFFTRHYREALQEGKFYASRKSAVAVALMTLLSLLAISGFLGTQWYVKPVVFLLSVPVACFWLVFPAYSWVAGRLKGPSKERHAN